MNLEPISGIAAGVPFVAIPPTQGQSASAPAVFAWHLLDPPRTPQAFAAALPLDGADVWRFYLGLPMSGARMPAGGVDEIMRLAYDDAVLNLYGPISSQAFQEFPDAYGELRERFGITEAPIALLGGSLGAAIASLVLMSGEFDVSAAVLVSPLLQLRPLISAAGQQFGHEYAWSEESEKVADRLDIVAQSHEFKTNGSPATLIVVGEEDLEPAFLAPAQALHRSLSDQYDDPSHVALETIEGMAHALADEPGSEPSPQTQAARRADHLAVQWLNEHFVG